MAAHQYRITMEYLGGKHAGPDLHSPLTFTAENHDDLFEIIEHVQAARFFDPATSAALTLGMKLFSEVMLKNRNDPMFAPMLAAYRDYIRVFKQRMAEATPRQEVPGVPPHDV
jgi:hypothetical protein